MEDEGVWVIWNSSYLILGNKILYELDSLLLEKFVNMKGEERGLVELDIFLSGFDF